MPVAGIGPGAQPVQVPAPGQQIGQPPGGGPVAGVGPGAQPVQVAPFGQQIGQPIGDVRSPASARARRTRSAPSRSSRSLQQAGQPLGGGPVAGVGPGAQPVQVSAPGQQAGQPPGGGPVASIGGGLVQRDGVAVQQPVLGAVGKPVGVGGVADMGEDGVPGSGGHAHSAAVPAGVLEQVIRHGVSGDLAHDPVPTGLSAAAAPCSFSVA